MQALQSYLAEMRYWELLAIARARQLHLRGSRPPKALLVPALASRLTDPDAVRQAVRALPEAARAALQALLAAGGALPWAAFCARYGEVRPIPTNQPGVVFHPERAPASPAEALAYQGLLLRVPYRPAPGEAVQARIPAEILPLLADQVRPPPAPTRAALPPLALPAVLDDVATLLSLLHQQAVRPAHGRWLAPRVVQQWNERSVAPATLPRLRHERLAPRLAFLHLLAEAAELLAPVGGWLKPSLAGWQWLHAPTSERYRLLWEGWLAAARTPLWERYQQPASTQPDPAALIGRVLSHLQPLVPGATYDLAAFAHYLSAVEGVFWQQATYWETLGEGSEDEATRFVRELITGPLAW